MMHIGGENERHAEQAQEISDQNPLLVLRWVDGGDESQAKLLGNDGARDLEGGNRETCREPQHSADNDFLEQKHQDRPDCVEVDRIGLLMRRQDNRRKHQRDAEPHTRGHCLLSDAGQQHHHRADARKSEQKRRRKCRQK